MHGAIDVIIGIVHTWFAGGVIPARDRARATP
jgi:hypothetical protein